MSKIQITHEHDLVKVVPKDAALYGDISLAALTVYSLYWLHQWELRRSIEAVAVLNWRLFPKKFGMVGFPEYPDAFRTNRSLLQGQPKYRNWLTGAASKGFSLNDSGIRLAQELIAKLGPPAAQSGQLLGQQLPTNLTPRAGGRARSIEPEREVQRARGSKLFVKWQSGSMSERDLIHVHSLLGIFDHTPPRIRQKLLNDLERSASDAKDDEVLQFLSDVRRSFPLAFTGWRE
jgi:hypothetical protein